MTVGYISQRFYVTFVACHTPQSKSGMRDYEIHRIVKPSVLEVMKAFGLGHGKQMEPALLHYV